VSLIAVTVFDDNRIAIDYVHNGGNKLVRRRPRKRRTNLASANSLGDIEARLQRVCDASLADDRVAGDIETGRFRIS
jgi:hypothetical protein